MRRYIHQLKDWPKFHWNHDALGPALSAARARQALLMGKMEGLGFSLQKEAALETLTLDVLKSSEIEGEILNVEQVRSSVARQLRLDIAGLVPSDRNVDGVVAMTLDATQGYAQPLNAQRLFRWHAQLFPEQSRHLKVGAWRDDAKGPMQVVSGAMGREKVHYEAPPARLLDKEMTAFLGSANAAEGPDPLLKAAVAHLWFVTIHPFDDGNGRIARAISDWALARSEGRPQRFYSLSAQIRKERSAYYDILESTQKGSLDITPWLSWFLACLERSIEASHSILAAVLNKSRFWQTHAAAPLNARQRLILNKLLDGFEGKLTTQKWAKLAKCSHDSALRDIQALLSLGILIKDAAGGRSTSYSLKP